MSGIGIDESCVNLFMHMKTKSMVSWQNTLNCVRSRAALDDL